MALALLVQFPFGHSRFAMVFVLAENFGEEKIDKHGETRRYSDYETC